jgi:hypothetical protein
VGVPLDPPAVARPRLEAVRCGHPRGRRSPAHSSERRLIANSRARNCSPSRTSSRPWSSRGCTTRGIWTDRSPFARRRPQLQTAAEHVPRKPAAAVAEQHARVRHRFRQGDEVPLHVVGDEHAAVTSRVAELVDVRPVGEPSLSRRAHAHPAGPEHVHQAAVHVLVTMEPHLIRNQFTSDISDLTAVGRAGWGSWHRDPSSRFRRSA